MKLEDLELINQLAVFEARESFWAFRQFINPNMKLGWWQRLICNELEDFYYSYLKGERPKLIIQAPPQHGKSQMIVDFLAWVSGKDPGTKSIYTSFSERLGIRANLTLQRMLDKKQYALIFPKTVIKQSGGNETRSRSLLEFSGYDGYFRNTTVQGSITGESLDIGIIDDPLKGRKHASSKTERDNIWYWLTTDFFSRFSEEAGMITIMTRWNVDDPAGKLKEKFGDEVKVISFPAIAVEDEEHRKEGEALFPQHKSLEFLLERKKLYSVNDWEALYQQNPMIVGGEIIKVEKFGRYETLPMLKYRTIYADTAQKTAERNDYSVFQCWGYGNDGNIYLIDSIRGKWEAPELKRRAVDFWNKHNDARIVQKRGALRDIRIEDKASGTGLIQELKSRNRLPIVAIQRSVDKYTRLLDVVSYIDSGYVMIPEMSSFNSDFLSECESFSADNSHAHDDQVDPLIDAINDMLASNNTIKQWENMI